MRNAELPSLTVLGRSSREGASKGGGEVGGGMGMGLGLGISTDVLAARSGQVRSGFRFVSRPTTDLTARQDQTSRHQRRPAARHSRTTIIANCELPLARRESRGFCPAGILPPSRLSSPPFGTPLPSRWGRGTREVLAVSGQASNNRHAQPDVQFRDAAAVAVSAMESAILS